MFHRSTVPAARVIRTLTLGLLAITLPLSARGLYGPQGAWVHARWQPSMDATERQRLETAWQLVALLHESSLARTMPTDRILTDRCDMTLVGRTRSPD